MLMRPRDLPRGAGAILRHPAGPQPVGSGQPLAVQARQRGIAVLGDLA